MAPTVILIGFMGAGKSTVGGRLFRELGWDFIDADRVVEKEMGMDIPRAFAEKGEDGFRREEERVTLSLLDQTALNTGGTVIALGGGAVTIRSVTERLQEEPLVFFLDVDLDTAYERSRDTSRPLAEDAEKFRSIFADRQRLYRDAATYVIDTRGREAGQVAGEIVRILREGGHA